MRKITNFIEHTWQKAAMKRLQKWRISAAVEPRNFLRKRVLQAQVLRGLIDRFLSDAQKRLIEPSRKDSAFSPPRGTQWGWRPDPWFKPYLENSLVGIKNGERLGDCIAVFHDCTHHEMILRQVQRVNSSQNAPFALRLEVMNCSGSFCSLALDLPKEALENLTHRAIFKLNCVLRMEKGVEVYARLNIKSGPNVEQVLAKLDLEGDKASADFDLGYVELNTQRLENAWLDIIFQQPAMNAFYIDDLTLYRYPRAEL